MLLSDNFHFRFIFDTIDCKPSSFWNDYFNIIMWHGICSIDAQRNSLMNLLYSMFNLIFVNFNVWNEHICSCLMHGCLQSFDLFVRLGSFPFWRWLISVANKQRQATPNKSFVNIVVQPNRRSIRIFLCFSRGSSMSTDEMIITELSADAQWSPHMGNKSKEHIKYKKEKKNWKNFLSLFFSLFFLVRYSVKNNNFFINRIVCWIILKLFGIFRMVDFWNIHGDFNCFFWVLSPFVLCMCMPKKVKRLTLQWVVDYEW